MIRGLHHVAIDVDDLPVAIAFYRDALGLAILEDRPASLGDNGVWFDLGVGQLHLVQVDGHRGPPSQHLALQVDDTHAEVARLRAAGCEVSDPFDIGAGVQAFLRDPAGNLVELNQPT